MPGVVAEHVRRQALEEARESIAICAGGRYEGLDADLDQSIRSAKLTFPEAKESRAIEIGTAWLTKDIRDRMLTERAEIISRVMHCKTRSRDDDFEIGGR